MPITFVPHAGDVLMCDFTGFQPPEMTKLRRVIVLSPRSRTYFPNTFIVVPVSKTAPAPLEDWHCEFRPNSYHFFDSVESVWAKADMITCVAKHRLDRMRINNRFMTVAINKCDLMRVRTAVLAALGMSNWREVVNSVGEPGLKVTVTES